MASRALPLAFALTAFLLGAPSAHSAETPTPVSYLDPYNMDWLAYLDPADVPPNPYAVCIVDTGVAITPDTPADNPSGPIVKRYAFDGGTGEPQTTNSFGLHGTRMAMAATAPINDWGTVGAWPGARIISMRATKESEQFIRISYYDQPAFECVNTGRGHRVGVILWSFSCRECQPTGSQAASLDDTIVAAHQRGASIVAAAGNQAGPLHYPADQPGVLSVSAGSASGGLCANSAFSESVAVIGPGCPVESGDPLTGVPQAFSDGGTSTASVAVATLIAALRSLQPSTHSEAERWVRESARQVDGRPVLDGEAAARLAGIGAVVDRAIAKMPQAAPPSPAPAPTATPTVAATPGPLSTIDGDVVSSRLPPPERDAVTARVSARSLRISVGDRPLGARLEARVGSRTIGRARDVVIVRVRRTLRRVDLRYSPSGDRLDQPSRWLRLRRGSRGHFY